jgi:hypothetical protein
VVINEISYSKRYFEDSFCFKFSDLGLVLVVYLHSYLFKGHRLGNRDFVKLLELCVFVSDLESS